MNCPKCGKFLTNPRSKTCREHIWLPKNQRFFSHIKKTKHCWIWKASKNRRGYGLFEGLAHRFSYKLHKGNIPEGKNVCHDCSPLPDNRSCVNPDHLWVGTQKDNMHDASVKCSWKNHRGDKHPAAKINFAIADKIRNLHDQGLRQTKIAEQFKISHQLVSIIVRNEAWVKMPSADLPLSFPPKLDSSD